jgi:hypothetical protein
MSDNREDVNCAAVVGSTYEPCPWVEDIGPYHPLKSRKVGPNMSPRPCRLAILVAAIVFFASATAQAQTPGCAAAGTASALPPRLLLGWGANFDDTWAQKSGTKWDVQWFYLTGQTGNNWYNDWGYGTADGSSLDGILKTVDGYGFIPGIHLYNMGYGHDGGDAGLVTEIQNPQWTKSYFAEFKVMMQKMKNFGKPVIIVLEGDSFGMVEMLVKNDPTTAAAVASSGLAELAGLPNTVAGFGQAYLAIRKSVGATNVMMGPDTPYYAANGDIMNWPDTASLQSHVDYQWKFFGPLGVGDNATGARFDFSASCPMAADCAYYTDGRPCWDPSDAASISKPSINRYVEWLRLYNQTSGARWVLHQVPIGNSQHRNVPYDGSARSGYKDNKVEYLLQSESPASPAIRTQHLTNFANAGVVGILFGFSDDGDTPTTDLWTDNQPFLRTHVAAINNSGGFTIAASSGCGVGIDGGGAGGAIAVDAGRGGAGGATGADGGGAGGRSGAGGASGTGGRPGSTGGSSIGGGLSTGGAVTPAGSGGLVGSGGNLGSGGFSGSSGVGGVVVSGGAGEVGGGGGSSSGAGGTSAVSQGSSSGCGCDTLPNRSSGPALLLVAAAALMLRRRARGCPVHLPQRSASTTPRLDGR